MVTESLAKKGVTSGTITIVQDLTEPIVIDVPVGPAKFEEGSQLMEELWAVMMKHYRRSDRLSPRDTIRCLENIEREWSRHEQSITISKYRTYKQKATTRH
jgi:hypothetical protein